MAPRQQMSTDSLKELGFAEYWNKRYENLSGPGDSSHEWFRSFDHLRILLETHLPPPSANPWILHLGCGDSVRLPQHPLPSYQFLSSPYSDPKLSVFVSGVV